MSQRKEDEAKREDNKSSPRLFRTKTHKRELKQVMSPRPEDHTGFLVSEPRYTPRTQDVIEDGKKPDQQIPHDVYNKEMAPRK